MRKELVILSEPTERYMTSPTKNEEIKKRVYNDTISNEPELVRDDDPVVMKKMERMREILEKAPFPEEFLPRNRRKL